MSLYRRSSLDQRESLINNIDMEKSEIRNTMMTNNEQLRFNISNSRVVEGRNLINNMSLSTIRNTRSQYNSDYSTLKKIDNILQPQPENVLKRYASSKKTTFKRKHPLKIFVSKKLHYLYIRCEIITTYFINSYVFSLFTDPKEIENSKEVNCKFLLSSTKDKNPKYDRFNYNDINFDNLDVLKLTQFIKELNSFFHSPGYVNIFRKNYKRKVIYYSIFTLMIISFILIIVISCVEGLFDKATGREYNFWLIVIAIFILEAILLYSSIRLFFYAFSVLNEIRKYEIFLFHLKDYHNIEAFFAKWNFEFFLLNGVFVTCPLNLEYIQFNFDPSNEIVLEHHDVNEEP
jgi:hypothetical protein